MSIPIPIDNPNTNTNPSIKKNIPVDIKMEEVTEEQPDSFNKRTAGNYDTEHSKRQESRMMNFFNQEFFDRKIDFKPKYRIFK
jgi:hypothetical protein